MSVASSGSVAEKLRKAARTHGPLFTGTITEESTSSDPFQKKIDENVQKARQSAGKAGRGKSK